MDKYNVCGALKFMETVEREREAGVGVVVRAGLKRGDMEADT